MSEEDNVQNLPSATECDKRCKQFADISGTDTALAMFYLQDRNWDLDTSLNAFFESTAQSTSTMNKSSKRRTDANLDEPSAKRKETCNTNTDDSEPHRIRVLTWNIDGLDSASLIPRTKSICQTINRENPHIVCLQEVVPSTYVLLEDLCPLYSIISGKESCNENEEALIYFTCIMVKVEAVCLLNHKIIPFENTVMMRNLLIAECKVKDQPVTVITSHLESTKDFSRQRTQQLRKSFEAVMNIDKDQTVFFGGDLNLRDSELQSIAGPPKSIEDVWEVSGARPECAYTWDLTRNDNLKMPFKNKPRCRFDRLYIRHAKTPSLEPVYTELIGLERVKACGKFPSDHWGLLTHYNILNCVKKNSKK